MKNTTLVAACALALAAPIAQAEYLQYTFGDGANSVTLDGISQPDSRITITAFGDSVPIYFRPHQLSGNVAQLEIRALDRVMIDFDSIHSDLAGEFYASQTTTNLNQFSVGGGSNLFGNPPRTLYSLSGIGPAFGHVSSEPFNGPYDALLVDGRAFHYTLESGRFGGGPDSGAIFSITTISTPEPSTYAMLLAGLGMMAYMLRRRA